MLGKRVFCIGRKQTLSQPEVTVPETRSCDLIVNSHDNGRENGLGIRKLVLDGFLQRSDEHEEDYYIVGSLNCSGDLIMSKGYNET